MGAEKPVLHGHPAGGGTPDHGDIPPAGQYPVRVTANMHDLVERAGGQNFIPVVDDKDAFIGIVTRSAIIKYCRQQLFPED